MEDEVEEVEDGAEEDVEKLTFHFAVPQPVTTPKHKDFRKSASYPD